jgi:hypothetical protein
VDFHQMMHVAQTFQGDKNALRELRDASKRKRRGLLPE